MNVLKRLALGVALAALLVPAVTFAATARNADSSLTLEAGETVTDDIYAASDDVVIAGTVDGNVIVAGSNVTINGNVTKDIWAAASTVTVNGTVGGSVHAAASHVNVSGKVTGDVVAAGSTVELRKGAEISRDAWIAGSTLNVDGTVGRNLRLGGNRGTISGTVRGDVNARTSQSLNLAAGSVIGGNLTYRSPDDLNRDPQATVSGTVTQTKPDHRHHGYFDRLRGQLYWFLAAVVLLIVVLLYARRAAVTASRIIIKRPGPSVLAGLLFLAAVPLASAFLLISIVGIPLALMSLFMYVVVIYTSKIFVALQFGGWLLKNGEERFWSAFAAGTLGLVFFYLLVSIPVVGWIFSFVAVLFGVGAQVLLARHVYHDVRRKYGS